MRFTIFFLFVFIFLSVSCTKEQDIIDIEEEPFMPITNVEVQTLIISIGEKIPFTCTINDQEYSSTEGDVLLIKDILLDQKGNSILIQSNGYFDEIRYVIPTLNSNLYLEVTLTKIISKDDYSGEFNGFEAKEGGIISCYDANISIKPNSIVDEMGNTFEGHVRVFASSTFRAAYFSNIRRFPQNYFTRNETNNTLNIGGGLNIVLMDNSENRLYFKKGTTADINFEVKGGDQIGLPDVMDLMFYDVENDDWIDMGTVEKEGETWHGSLTHLGIIAWGNTHENRVAQIKLTTDEGHIIANKFVWLHTDLLTPQSMAFSDNEGLIRIHIPVGSEFTISTLEFDGAQVIASKDYSMVGSGQEEVVILDDFVLNSELYQNYKGNVIDCNENIITKSAVVMKGFTNSIGQPEHSTYLFSGEDGEFNFAQTKTQVNPIMMQAFDLNTDKLSEIYNVINNEETTIDFESLIICE